MGIKWLGRTPVYQASEQADINTVSTAGARLLNMGNYNLNSTSTGGPVVVLINGPEKGKRVGIMCQSAGSTSSPFQVDTTSTGYTFDGSNTRIAFRDNDAIQLIGLSSTRYLVESVYTGTTLGFSTSTSA